MADIEIVISPVPSMEVSITTASTLAPIEVGMTVPGPKGDSATINGMPDNVTLVAGTNISLDINETDKTIAISSEIDTSSFALKTEIPTNTSQLINDSSFVSDADYIHTDNNYTSIEKIKLAGIADGANNYIHPNDSSTRHVTDAQISYWDGKVDQVVGKQLSTEDYTSSEKSKLAGIEANANNYVHPVSHPASIITQDSSNRFVTDTEKSTWDAKQNALGFTPVPDTRTVNGHALTSDVTVSKSDVGLSNADNTSDINKPISTATQTQLDIITKNQAFIRSTGLIYGGDIEIGSTPTKFSVSAGFGYIIDNFTNSATPVATQVSWTNQTDIDTPFLSTDTNTYIYFNSLGEIVTKNSYPSAQDMRELIYVGFITHLSGEIIDTKNEPIEISSIALQVQDFFASFGAFNISGNTYSYASNDLTAKRTAGKTFSANSNYDANKMIPHILTTNEENPMSIHYYYRDAFGEWVNTEPDVNYIDPNYYDSGTGKQLVPDTKWTVQVLAFYAQTEENDIQYGQVVYDSYAEAVSAIQVPVSINPYNEYDTFRGWLVVQKGCTDLSDPTKASFIPAGKLGLFDVASGGGTGGEVNTASNIGDSGVGVWKDKTGVDLRFKKIRSSSANLTVTDNLVSNTVDLDVSISTIKTNLALTKSDVGLSNADNTSDTNKPISTATAAALGDKVDKITGKGLSTEDYTSAEKTKLSGIAAGAEVNVQADWNEASNLSDAYIKNKPTIPSIANLFDKTVDDTDDITIGTNNKFLTTTEQTKLSNISVSQPVNLDTMESDIAGKQATLVSGENIKTIDGVSILGAGNITTTGGGVDVATVNRIAAAMAIALG